MKQSTNIKIITSSKREPQSSVLLIYTGGTLGMVHDESGTLIPFDFSSILYHVPSLKQLELNLTVISFDEPIDSSNISIKEWQLLGSIIYENYDKYDGFVVLHGTDTMAFTASAASFMLENLNKPVVFTGAQLPISSLRSDARENLITALEIASKSEEGEPLVPEVCIYFDSSLLRGNRAKKVESIHFDAFQSENYPKLAVAGVTINYNTAVIKKAKKNKKLILHNKFDPNVVILKLHPGITEGAVAAVLNTPNLRGVILETYGAGNAPSASWFINLLKSATARGIVIVNVSQCPGGRVMHGRYGTSQQLQRIGVIEGVDLTLEAAITKLMMVLGEEDDIESVRKRLMEPMSGELTLN